MLITPNFVSPVQLLPETSSLYIQPTSGQRILNCMCPNQNAWYCLLLLWSLSPLQLMAAPRFQACSSQACDSYLLVPFSCLMPSISMNSIGSILKRSPEPALSHWCIVAPVKIGAQSFLCGDQNPSMVCCLTRGKVSHRKTYTISLLFLTLPSDSPFLTSRTSSPTSFPPAHSDSSPVAPIGSTRPPKSPSFLGLNALLLDSCRSHLGLLCLLLWQGSSDHIKLLSSHLLFLSFSTFFSLAFITI